MFIINREFTFDAAHKLPHYDGPCNRLHGHRWKLVISLIGKIQTDGMVTDFAIIKQIVQTRVLDRLDHYCLNDIIFNPTAENLCLWIRDQLVDVLKGLNSITLWEGEHTYVTLLIPQ